MARWEAVLIVAIGLGTGLAITTTTLLPLSHALTGTFRPYIPAFAGSQRCSARPRSWRWWPYQYQAGASHARCQVDAIGIRE